jgi:LysM repeat protein
VTERGLPLADGAPACPFVAFEDDRDERASVPDHRHRCYADARPAPRALAHQEAYCLSRAFPVCPTFQDWARREAARSRGGAPTAPSASAGMNRAATGAASDAAAVTDSSSAGAAPSDDDAGAGDGRSDGPGLGAAAVGGVAGAVGGVLGDVASSAGSAGSASSSASAWGSADRRDDDSGSTAHDSDRDAPDVVRRNPPRDWSAPPPWLASNERRREVPADPPPFLGRRATDPGRGLAGSAADRMAGGGSATIDEEGEDVWSSDSRSAAAAGAGLAAERAAAPGRRPAREPDDRDGGDDDEEPVRRPTRRSRAYSQHLGGPDGPDWEQPRRYEAYPTIKSRVEMPAVPRLAGLAALIGVLALALFFLPGILNIGGTTPPAGSSPGASSVAGPSVSIAPTVPPAPTPSVYTIKKGETLSKIATAHGITIEELLAANPAIKNPNRISEGQQIVIPVPGQSTPTEVGESAAP